MSIKTNKIQLRTLLWATFALLLALSLVMPLLAQDTTENVDDMTDNDDGAMIVGIYGHNQDDDIIVTATDVETGETQEYIIAPASAFNPSDYEDGDWVMVIGRELGDGSTIQAIEFGPFTEDENAPATDEMEATDEATEEATVEATVEVTEDQVVEEVSACASRNHPVANRIAEEFGDEFGVTASDVMAMHCDHNGFGNIARAFLLARKMREKYGDDSMLPQDFLELHHSGMGWGQIVKATGIHPSELAPGRIGKSKFGDDALTSSTRGNGKDKDKGNRGNHGNNGNNGNNGNHGNSGNKGGKK